MRAPRRIYLIGTAGNPNYGDEMITKRWLVFLARIEPEAEMWLDTPYPGPAAALLRGSHSGLRVTDTLYRLCSEAPSDSPEVVAEFVVDALANPGLAPRWVPGIEVLRSADLVHILGGGYINDIWPRHIGLVAAAGWLATERGIRVAATGLGLTPLNDGLIEVWRRVAAGFAVLIVRDQPSLDLYTGLGTSARIGPDDIFLDGLHGVYAADAHEAPRFMVCVQSDLLEERDFATLTTFVGASLGHWGALGPDVGFLECFPRGDRRIFEALKGDYPGSRFYSLWDVSADGLPAARHQTWISTRYHAHVLASAAGARGVALSVRADYYDTKHDTVRRMGSMWPTVNPTQKLANPGDAGTIRGTVRDFAQLVGDVADQVYGR